MAARVVTVDDVDWVVAALGRRRAPLVEHAPVFWRPAVDATERHRDFITHLITDGGARAYRTQASVLIATPRGDGWLIDDAAVKDGRWCGGDGVTLWNALASDVAGAQARFVSPTYEGERGEFAQAAGLRLDASWWLLELEGSGGGQAGIQVRLPGADAVTVAAPPVYAPPGPILFLPGTDDPAPALLAVRDRAQQLGCAAIVVNQGAKVARLTDHLASGGFRRHCDYYAGAIQPM